MIQSSEDQTSASEVEAIRRGVVDDPDAQPGLAEPIRRLLVAHEFGMQIVGSDRTSLRTYAEACGATGGDPDVGAALEILLDHVDREGAFLDKVSFAYESAGIGMRDDVCVDLEVVIRSCDEAIAGRPHDGSIPRVTLSADALRAIASFAKAIADEASRASSGDPACASPARRGPVVTGSAANDVWGEVVRASYGHPLDDPPDDATKIDPSVRGAFEAGFSAGVEHGHDTA